MREATEEGASLFEMTGFGRKSLHPIHLHYFFEYYNKWGFFTARGKGLGYPKGEHSKYKYPEKGCEP
jgi:hypothetical protein